MLPEFAKNYFLGEKTEAWWIFLIAILLVAISMYCFFVVKEPFSKGLGCALLVMALMMGSASSYIYLRTDAQVSALTLKYESSQQSFYNEEVKRMNTVIDNYKYYKIMYVAAVLAGLLLLLMPSQLIYKGIGTGLICFAVVGFVIDYYSEARAVVYFLHLNH